MGALHTWVSGKQRQSGIFREVGRQNGAPGSPNSYINLYCRSSNSCKTRGTKKICTFSIVLKAKSELDRLVRRHWAGRDLTGGMGRREEKHKTQGNDRRNTQDLATKQGHPSQFHALLGAEGRV